MQDTFLSMISSLPLIAGIKITNIDINFLEAWYNCLHNNFFGQS